ncbi:MAG: hypothetical protein E7Z70_01720 [Thermoplasmata archaeon]|nr:hypothetical protein [Thermoplasmata archaeon]
MYSKYSILGYDDTLKYRLFYSFLDDPKPKPFQDVRSTVILFKGFLQSSQAVAHTMLSSKLGDKNVTNTSLTANLNNSVDIDISIDAQIEQLMGDIENNGYLDDKTKAEILENIQEIGAILNSTDSKSEKWSRLRDKVLWAANQGVEIGAAVLKIITKVI